MEEWKSGRVGRVGEWKSVQSMEWGVGIRGRGALRPPAARHSLALQGRGGERVAPALNPPLNLHPNSPNLCV